MPPRSSDFLASPADHATCRALIREGSKSFFAASLLLPPPVREGALALYAFCRVSDDAVDCDPGARPLSGLRERLELLYQRRPQNHAPDRAFADVVLQYDIPRALPEALLQGFEWDLCGRSYETLSDLNAYAARVAGTVGAMMACLMGARAPRFVARACDLGVAMQLTNIARDVGEDARAGRLYLPLQWLREAGIDPRQWLAEPRFSIELGTVVQKLLRFADSLYQRAGRGIQGLPRDCWSAIHAARLLYAEIGYKLEREGLDSISRRTVVPLARKTSLLMRAVLSGVDRECAEEPPPLEETRFLVEAVAAHAAVHGTAIVGGRSLDDRVEWLVDLFERLERREQARSPAGSSLWTPAP